MKEEEKFELSEAEMKDLTLIPEEIEKAVPEDVKIEEEIELAYSRIPEKIVCDIGRRFIYCVSRAILAIIKKMCENPKYREYICKACKSRRPDMITRLVCPILLRTFNCIPCMKPVVYYLCPRLIKDLFWRICRICKCY